MLLAQLYSKATGVSNPSPVIEAVAFSESGSAATLIAQSPITKTFGTGEALLENGINKKCVSTQPSS